MKHQCSQCMETKDCMEGTLVGKEENTDVWLCRECRSGAAKNPKDHKKAMEYAVCLDTQSHLKKCGKCMPKEPTKNNWEKELEIIWKIGAKRKKWLPNIAMIYKTEGTGYNRAVDDLETQINNLLQDDR